MKPLVTRADAVMADVRKRARGQVSLLRVGYLMSAATEYLNPALARLRKVHAEPSVTREFFVKRIALLPVVVAMPASHPLSAAHSIALAELRREVFVGAHDRALAGYDRWIVQLCRWAGFRPRFVENSDSLTHALSMLLADNAVTLLRSLAERIIDAPQVTFRRLRQPNAHSDPAVAWQRGKISDPVRQLLEALNKPAA